MSLERRVEWLESELEMAHEGPPLEERLHEALEEAKARRLQGQPPAVELPNLDSPLGRRLQAALQRAEACRALLSNDRRESPDAS